MSRLIIDKVVAYITSGNRLLVFRHTGYPEAGVQVPAGTLEPGETPLQGALREAREETGLETLSFASFLGIKNFDPALPGIEQLHRRYFYHFTVPLSPPEHWLHREEDPSDQSAAYYEFEFTWAPLPDGVPVLSGEQDAMLPELLRAMSTIGGEQERS